VTELPKGWVRADLGELAATSLGKMLDAKQQTGEHPAPYLRNINVRWGTFDLDDIATMDIEPHQMDRVLALPGDVIACEGGEPGRCAVWRGEPVALQKALHRIRPVSGVIPEYLAFALQEQASTRQLDRLFTGTTIKHLPQEKLRIVPVALAPTAEQERIVAAIEEAFSKLDAGEAGLRTVRQRLKRMRDAILAAAVTGRLVPQDPTDTPATKLLADVGIEPLSHGPYEIPDGWVWASLGGLLREPLRNGLSAPAADPSVGLPTFSISAVTTGDFSDTNIKYTSADWGRAEDLWAEPGDVFVQRSNTPELVGTARLYTGAPRAAVFPDLLIRVRPVEHVLPAWVETVMSAGWCRDHVRHQAKGLAGSMPKISQPVLMELPLPVPPAEEQARIVTETERQMSFVEACERAVDAGVQRSAALRRSVLKEAFEGRLVPQDPTDEPASVLLERIRAERAAAPKAKTRRAKAKS